MATKKKSRKVSYKQALRKLEHDKLKEEAVDRAGSLFGDWAPVPNSTLAELMKIRDIAVKTIKEAERARKRRRALTTRKKK